MINERKNNRELAAEADEKQIELTKSELIKRVRANLNFLKEFTKAGGAELEGSLFKRFTDICDDLVLLESLEMEISVWEEELENVVASAIPKYIEHKIQTMRDELCAGSLDSVPDTIKKHLAVIDRYLIIAENIDIDVSGFESKLSEYRKWLPEDNSNEADINLASEDYAADETE